jgi:DNA-binding CsgD family transcriptional regulator
VGRLSKEDELLLERIRSTLRVVNVDAKRRRATLVGLVRERHARPRSQARRLLLRLRPAIATRLRLEKNLTRVEALNEALERVLARFPGSAFVRNAGGEVLISNGRRGSAAGTGDAKKLTFSAPSGETLTFVFSPRAGRTPRVALERVGDAWGLTPRELEVLSRLVAGDSNEVIGLALKCSRRTVEVHVGRLFQKSGSPNRTALIARVWKQA